MRSKAHEIEHRQQESAEYREGIDGASTLGVNSSGQLRKEWAAILRARCKVTVRKATVHINI
jgi:hypothetical protein